MKIQAKIVSMLLALCVVMGLTTVPASASSAVRYNVSYSPVTGNADNANLPATISEAYVGDSIYFNVQVGTDIKLQGVDLWIEAPDGSGGKLFDQEWRSGNSFLRYMFSKPYQPSCSGILKYTFVLFPKDGGRMERSGSVTVHPRAATIKNGPARCNVSRRAVSGNASVVNLPTSIGRCYVNETVYLNMQVSADVTLKQYELFIKTPGSSKFESYNGKYCWFNNYFRYSFDQYTPNEVGKYEYRFDLYKGNWLWSGVDYTLSGSFEVVAR